MSSKPITPNDVLKTKLSVIPEVVIEIINELLAKAWNGQTAQFKQQTLIETIKEKLDVSAEYMYNEGWFDFEPLYEDAGWVIDYDRPAYNESYPATWSFKPQKNTQRE